MNLTPTQIRTCWSITHIFETSKARGDYSALAVLDDGAGISYGVSQATDGSGALDKLPDPSCPLKHDNDFRQLLVDAGTDPVMRQTQDEVFSELYWEPAVAQGDALGLVEPLSFACLYDLAIQSGHGRLSRLRRKFPQYPPVRGGQERSWVYALNNARHEWLGLLRSSAARASVYRTRSLRVLMDDECWDLALPLDVRGVTISESDL